MNNFRKSITCFLCCCLCATLAAQTSEIDSLEQVLALDMLDNVEKAELLENLSSAYLNVDSAKSRTYAMEALKLAQNNNGLKLQEGFAHYLLGTYYVFANRHYSAHIHFRNAEKLFLKINNKQQLIDVYRSQMMLFDIVSDKENTMYYANKLVELSIELDDPDTELFAQYILGRAHFNEDVCQEMLDFFLDLYQKAVSINNSYTISILETCGDLCLKLNRPREALTYLHKVRESFESGQWSMVMQSTAYHSIAEAYAMLRRVDLAEYYLGKAINTKPIYEEVKIRSHYTRSLIDTKKGHYRSALESYKKFHHLTDSIHKAQKTADIARMKNWYELEQTEILQQEKQNQRRLILILAGALAIIVALFVLSVSLYRKTAKNNRELKKLHTVKDKLFSVVAHDLRSPMSALKTVLGLDDRNMLDPEAQAKLLKDISSRVDDTISLLNNMLHWAKGQMLEIGPLPVYFNIENETRTVVDSLRDIAATKKITLNNLIEDQIVYADRDMFSIVIRNLASNAIKFTSAEGEITIASEMSGDQNMLIVSVKDTGIGMTNEIQNQLFELSETRIRRGTNNERGAGLGLVLCVDFVEANGGSIWFTSSQGKGSTFFFSIPVKKSNKKLQSERRTTKRR